MPRVSQIMNAFNGGEIAPEVHGRTDIKKSTTGAKRIENFIVRPEGGLHRRSGSRFVKGAIDDDKKSRLIQFVYNQEQAYALEFSEYKIRLFANELQVEAEERVTTTNPNPVVATDEFSFEDHGYVHNQGPIHITATSGIPTPLAVDTDYWIVSPKTVTFSSTATDVVVATDIINTTVAHEYVTQMGPFRLSVTQDPSTPAQPYAYLPDPLQGDTDYYVEVIDATHIKLRLTAGGPPINILANGEGIVTLSPTGDYVRDKFRLAASAGGAPIDITVATGFSHTFTPNPAGTPTGFPQEIPSPYAESELYDLHFVQSADFLFITHRNHRPVQLTRTSNTQWALNYVSVIDGPYLPENIDPAITMQPTAATGYTTITAVGTTFSYSDIGRLIRIKVGANNWGYAEIYEVTGSTTVKALVISSFTATTADEAWRLGSWYTGNWPSSLSFVEQRLAFGGETGTPQEFHGSETGAYNGFSPTLLDGTTDDTSAVNFAFASNQVNAIRWMGVGARLLLGTANAVFGVRGSYDGEPITVDNVQVQRITSFGASTVQPVFISDQLVYISENSQRMFGLTTSRDVREQSPSPTDLTLLAKHIFGRTLTVTNMAYQQDRQQVLWCVRSDGVLAAVTYVPDQEVFAWHRHIIGGSFGSGAAVVESVCVIPAPNATHDQVWLSVKRTVDGNTVRHIEFFEDEWLDGVSTSMRYMDSAPAAYSGVAKSTFDGLDHLEGETVQVLANGAVHPDCVVSSGSITLDSTYTDIVAGLKYTSELETLRLDPPDPEGSSLGKVARIDHLVLRLFETVGGEVGPDTSNLDPLILRPPGAAMNEPTAPFTGDHKVAFEGGFKREKNIIVRQDKPLPLNLLAMNILQSTGAR